MVREFLMTRILKRKACGRIPTPKVGSGQKHIRVVKNMKKWRSHCLLSFTINMQGGARSYSQSQPWHNSAYNSDGSLKPDYGPPEKILDRADKLGMVPILGLFYFGQDERLADENAVRAAVDNVMEWLAGQNYRNVLIEINNECNIRYDHEILKPERVHELINIVRNKETNGFRFYAGTSYGGGFIPLPNVVQASDFILLHGTAFPTRMTLENGPNTNRLSYTAVLFKKMIT
jgi:hypothetical protein